MSGKDLDISEEDLDFYFGNLAPIGFVGINKPIAIERDIFKSFSLVENRSLLVGLQHNPRKNSSSKVHIVT